MVNLIQKLSERWKTTSKPQTPHGGTQVLCQVASKNPPRYKIQLPASALLQVQVQNPLAVVAKRAMPEIDLCWDHCFRLVSVVAEKSHA
jgi:hypothetical protein